MELHFILRMVIEFTISLKMEEKFFQRIYPTVLPDVHNHDHVTDFRLNQSINIKKRKKKKQIAGNHWERYIDKRPGNED